MTELALFSCVIVIGIFFRVYKISSLPPGLNHDAAWEGLYAVRIRQGIEYTPVVACCGSFARETMFFYFIAFVQFFLGPSRFAIQLASISIGVATIPALYLLIRRLFDVWLALLASFLLAVSGWHTTFSRVGWRLILVPLFACLLFFFLDKAITEGRRRDAILAGALLGLSLDTYEAARALPFVVLGYLLYLVIRTPGVARARWPQLALFSAAAAFAFAPSGWYMVHHWNEYTQRSEILWVGTKIREAGSLNPLITNTKDALLMFNFRANGDDFFVHGPLLDLPVSVFFVLGLPFGLVRWKRREYVLLGLILFLAMAIGIASKPNGNRAVLALIPVATFAALFLLESWRWFRECFPKYAVLFNAMLVIAVAYSAFASYYSYLGPDHRSLPGDDQEATVVGRYIHRIIDQDLVYAVAGNWAGFTMTYMSYPGNGDPFTPSYTYSTVADPLYAIPPAADKDTVFIIKIKPYTRKAYETLIGRFPAATTSVLSSKDLGDIAYVLRIPPGGGPGADLSSYFPKGAAERDARRAEALDTIALTLRGLRARGETVPPTHGAIVLACVSGQLGALCPLKEQIAASAFEDPRGSPLSFGYWYKSDGDHFTLYASFEALPPADKACHPRDEIVVDKPNLYCLHD